jgi:hypothetical protein
MGVAGRLPLLTAFLGAYRKVIDHRPIAAKAKSRYSPAMAKEFMCMVCDQPERSCSCNKYCALCQSLYEVRLCEDGIYYCRPCREACDLQAQVGGKSSSW